MPDGSAAVDEIWELIKETRKDMRESDARIKKFDARMEKFHAGMEELRAIQKETAEQLRETAEQLREKTDKQLRKTDRRFNTQWGRLVESLVEGSLAPLLQERGIEVNHTSPNHKVSFTGADGGLREKEFDIVALNGTEVVAVEVKTVLTPDKVRYFLSAMEDFKRYFPDYSHKSVYGAVAYLRGESEAERYAERRGLFVIRATGDSASIVNLDHFRPKEFPT